MTTIFLLKVLLLKESPLINLPHVHPEIPLCRRVPFFIGGCVMIDPLFVGHGKAAKYL